MAAKTLFLCGMFALKKPLFASTVAWVLVFSLAPLVFVYSQSDLRATVSLLSSYRYWVFILYFLAVYFLLENFLVPRLYFTNRALLLATAMLVLLAATLLLKPFDGLLHFSRLASKHERGMVDKPHGPPPATGNEKAPDPQVPNRRGGPVFDIVSVFLLLLVFLIVLADNALKKSRLTEKRAIQAEADRANAELSFLKAQINPHFLFNTLNNIYSLAVTKNESTADAVMKLSNIMRYVTGETNETMVPLEDEAACIQDYISLQKLRLGESFPVEFSIEGSTAGKTVPPLCLMTFVENAFKHGVSIHESNSIVFKLIIQDRHIHFFAQNKLFSTPRNTERTGIGLENAKKRLLALYPGKHVLGIEEKNGFYTVNLILYT